VKKLAWVGFVIAIGAVMFYGRCEPVKGAIREHVELALDGAKVVRVPATATLSRGGSQIEIAMTKRIGFAGHPPREMDFLWGGRFAMSVASRRDGEALEIGTYGEWDSHIEGGAWIELELRVPEGVEVVTDPALAGEKSRAQGPASSYDDNPRTYWYGPTRPADGWTPHIGT
jgi:hypothetical protein